MNFRQALQIAALGITACSVNGGTVNLVGGQSVVAGGAGGTLDGGAGGTPSGGTAGGTLMIDGGGGPAEVVCAPGQKTSVSGTVYDPAGNWPLYNAVVYVATPGSTLPAFKPTVSCEKCSDPVPSKAVLSGPDGGFVLDDVPGGFGTVDLVIQLGKWRRRQTVPVKPCEANTLTNRDFTRLPRTRAEGDIPKIALSTGHSDALECLLRKIGIDDSEFTTDAGPGRVSMFVGCVDKNGDSFGANKFSKDLGSAAFPSTNQLFDSGELSEYDMVIFSCEGHKCDTIQTPDNIAQLVDFTNNGGRVFLDHDHYNWLSHANAPIRSAAPFDAGEDLVSPLVAQINTVNFPKGEAFAAWLLTVNASKTQGTLDIYAAKSSVQGDLSPNRAQSWIYRTDPPKGYFYFTIGTPVAVHDDDPTPEACGRVVFTDLHVSATDGGESSDFSDQDTPFPGGCLTTTLSAQEKALEFMLFDLSSCVQQETTTPTAPPPPK
jgi:hypothetical protein